MQDKLYKRQEAYIMNKVTILSLLKYIDNVTKYIV